MNAIEQSVWDSETAVVVSKADLKSCRRSVEFHAARIHRIAGRYGIERDDLVQEGYVALMMSAGRYEDVGASLATFAGPGIKGAMLRFVQKWRGRGITGFGYQNGYERLPFMSLHTEGDGTDSDPITLLDLLPSGGPDPHAAAETSMVREAVQELPERERTVMMLFYWQELDQPEIGRRLGLSRRDVCRILRRARERLRERLGIAGQGGVLHGQSYPFL
jgi:RNA polymerase sigma factor (sigma-70 family)